MIGEYESWGQGERNSYALLKKLLVGSANISMVGSRAASMLSPIASSYDQPKKALQSPHSLLLPFTSPSSCTPTTTSIL